MPISAFSSVIPLPLYFLCSLKFLFVWSFSSHSRIFHSFKDVAITGRRLQILTYARHLWSLSNEGSLTCHTYCDNGASIYNVNLIKPVTLTPNAERLAVELLNPVFFRLRSVLAGIQTPNLPLAG